MKPEFRYVRGNLLDGEQQREALRTNILARNTERLQARYAPPHKPEPILSRASWLGILLLIAGLVGLAVILSGCDQPDTWRDNKIQACIDKLQPPTTETIEACSRAYTYKTRFDYQPICVRGEYGKPLNNNCDK